VLLNCLLVLDPILKYQIYGICRFKNCVLQSLFRNNSFCGTPDKTPEKDSRLCGLKAYLTFTMLYIPSILLNGKEFTGMGALIPFLWISKLYL
jgi:hypothetical protein